MKKKGKLNIYYDDEGDFLELNIGRYTEGSFKSVGNGIFERIDKKTKQVTGIAIHGFRKRTQKMKNLQLSLPIEIKVSS